MTKREIIILIILATFSLCHFLFFGQKAPSLDFLENKKVEFEGVVLEDADVRLNNQYLKIKTKNLKATILVKTNLVKTFEYKDLVFVRGVLEKPKNFTTSSGKEFDYVRYLSNQNIYFVLNYPEIEILSKDSSFSIKKYLFKFKNSFDQNIKKYTSFKEGSLASGLLLGNKGSFDNRFKEDLVETGTMHLVALSGYNVSVVVGSAIFVFSYFFGMATSLFLGFIFVVLFVLMTGASVTSVRAGIMASVMLLGKMYGREYFAGRILFIAGFLMVAYDYRVITDLSFQLSFLATWGVVYINPIIYNYFNFLSARFGFRDSITTSISATIAVLPLIVYKTGILSIVSVLVNSLILIFIPLAMLLVFITGSLAFVSSLLATFFGFVSSIVLKYIIFIIEYFGAIPFASVNISRLPFVFVVLVYLIMFWFVYHKHKKHS